MEKVASAKTNKVTRKIEVTDNLHEVLRISFQGQQHQAIQANFEEHERRIRARIEEQISQNSISEYRSILA